MSLIPCQWCKQMYATTWPWYVCTTCGFRICPTCLGLHHGQHGTGFKCSQCPFGSMVSR